MRWFTTTFDMEYPSQQQCIDKEISVFDDEVL